MKSILLLLLVGIVAAVYYYYYAREGFENQASAQQWALQDPRQAHYEEAHGSAPAGVNASPGAVQYEQNAASPPVNPAYKRGNPQNVNPEFKTQPFF